MTTLVGLASVKGSPGVTSTSLALAAAWPRPAVLLEADPAGGDLTFRTRAAHGGVLYARRSILSLAAAARAGSPAPTLVLEHSQRLSCGVDVVPGFTTASQSHGLANLWSDLGAACQASSVDVIVDLGRLDGRSPLLPLARSVDLLLMVAAATLASAAHLTEALADVAAATARHGAGPRFVPVLVGPDDSAERDCADLDELLRGSVVPTAAALPIPYDAAALARLEHGDRPSGRLGRTLLLRRARQLAVALDATPRRVPA